MNPTPEQETILSAVRAGESVIISAVAGSGKTSTLVLLEDSRPGLVLAFNRSTAEDFRSRFKVYQTSTSHKLCYDLIKANSQVYVKVNERKTENLIKYKLLKSWDDKTHRFGKPEEYKWWRENKDDTCQIISLAKAYGNSSDWRTILLRGELDYPTPISGLSSEGILDFLWKEGEEQRVIDFEDMITRGRKLAKKGPVCLVDEAQDFNPEQRKLAQALGEQLIVVGDPRQSIYGFRGADPDSMTRFQQESSLRSYPLSVNWRSGRNIIQEAKRYCKIEAGLDFDGIVDAINPEEVASKAMDGDVILCRWNAPLVDLYFSLLSKNKSARLCGFSGLEKDLINFAADLFFNDSVSIKGIQDYIDKQRLRLNEEKKLYKLRRVENLAEIMRVLLPRFSTLREFESLCTRLFALDVPIENGITLSTIHKAKGKEWNRVFWYKSFQKAGQALADWELIQEENLHYVAITRAKKELYYA